MSEVTQVTNEQIAEKLDALGAQMNWLCENMQSLFQFASVMGNNGGGIRGLMKSMKDAVPALKQMEVEGVGHQPGGPGAAS